MEVTILREAGFDEAMLGISLSYGTDMTKIRAVANGLAHKGDGHNKFLESMAVWMLVTAPRYWWSQYDTYRAGVTKQSESTMHTILANPLTQANFSQAIPGDYLDWINAFIKLGELQTVKALLPEGFLQRRVVQTNYMSIQRVIRQRRSHRLCEWHVFIRSIFDQCEHPEFLEEINDS